MLIWTNEQEKSSSVPTGRSLDFILSDTSTTTIVMVFEFNLGHIWLSQDKLNLHDNQSLDGK